MWPRAFADVSKVIDLGMGSLPWVIQAAPRKHEDALKWKRDAGESESKNLKDGRVRTQPKLLAAGRGHESRKVGTSRSRAPCRGTQPGLSVDLDLDIGKVPSYCHIL